MTRHCVAFRFSSCHGSRRCFVPAIVFSVCAVIVSAGWHLAAQNTPVVKYARLLVGDAMVSGIAVDPKGNAYLLGMTSSAYYPSSVLGEPFAKKLDSAGNVVYSASLPEVYDGHDIPEAIAADAAGNAYTAGGSWDYLRPPASVVKLDPGGNRIYLKTFGSGFRIQECPRDRRGSVFPCYYHVFGDYARAIAVDAAANAWAVGYTGSGDFPVTNDALQPLLQAGTSGFLTELDPTGAIRYSTHLGGNPTRIALGPQGDIYISGTAGCGLPTTPGALQPSCRGGQDGFVMRLDATGRSIKYCTYLGGSGDDDVRGIAVDSAGNAYVIGSTQSADFPPPSAPLNPPRGRARPYFVAKLNNSGSALIYSALLEGSPSAIAVDAYGNAVVVGGTSAADYPVVRPVQATSLNPTSCVAYIGGGIAHWADCVSSFISKLNPAGNAFIYSTYLGRPGNNSLAAVAVESSGDVYAGGYSANSPSDPRPSATAYRISDPPQVAPGLPEPQIRMNLPPGFYVSELKLADGQRHGYWSMEVAPSTRLAGGFIAGGAIQDSTQPPAWAAFSLARPGTVQVHVVAQVSPGSDSSLLSLLLPAQFPMTARVLDANKNPIGRSEVGATSLQFERALNPGFYIIELKGGLSAPLAAFQVSVTADTMSGSAYAGGYVVPGFPAFGAFYLPEQQDIVIKSSGAPANGAEGAGNLELRLLDANRNMIKSSP